MKRAFLTSLLGALLLLTGACKSRTDSKDAIRAGVVKHIASMKGLNVNNMDVVVTQATVNGYSAKERRPESSADAACLPDAKAGRRVGCNQGAAYRRHGASCPG